MTKKPHDCFFVQLYHIETEKFTLRRFGTAEPSAAVVPKLPPRRYRYAAVSDMRTQLLPSTYTDDEIKRILSAINRSSASGKRDYAMILMLVCLGMRAGDVVSLQFSEINWEESIINITAKKNGKDLQFPLFNDIGNAIIDWLRNGRRKSDLPYIFIPIKGHIHPITSGCLNNALNKYMTKAGINIAGRRHGTHSMRHSLATRMITNGEELPVISEVLGHGDTQVTTVYTSIDTEALRKCCLEIPVLHSNCYEDL